MWPEVPSMGKKRRSTRKTRKGRERQPEGRHSGPGRRVSPSLVKRMQQWPIHEVLVTEDWQEPCGHVQLLVSRRSPETGDFTTGVFLVDLGCLGVKDGFLALVNSEEYDYLVESLRSSEPIVSCDLDLAAKILLTSLEYAESLGFEPRPDAVDAFPLLIGADASACGEAVPVGDGKGKPFYVAGPDDDADSIMATLEQAVGLDGFRCILGEDEDFYDPELYEDPDDIDPGDVDPNVVEPNDVDPNDVDSSGVDVPDDDRKDV